MVQGSFPKPVPDGLMAAFAEPGPTALSARGRSGERWRQTRLDLQGLGNWHARWSYVRELVFPNAAHICGTSTLTLAKVQWLGCTCGAPSAGWLNTCALR